MPRNDRSMRDTSALATVHAWPYKRNKETVDRKTERQRDRDTERQKDRETERLRDRETDKQRDRETERQRNRETERQRESTTNYHSYEVCLLKHIHLHALTNLGKH